MDFDTVLDLDESDAAIQRLLARWAADRYSLDARNIKTVNFNFHRGYGGGCDTCGYGADEDSLECVVTLDTGGIVCRDESYSTGLIVDILRFAAKAAS